MWNSTNWATVALQAGADEYLARPLDAEHLCAKLTSHERIRQLTERHRERANEVSVLAERLHKTLEQHTAAQQLSRRIYRQLSSHSVPTSPHLSVAVHHRPRSRTSGDSYDISRNNSWWQILLTDTPNTLAGLYLRQLATRAIATRDPGELFTQLNDVLLSLEHPDAAIAAALFVTIDDQTGDIGIARAAMPPIVSVPVDGPLEVWTIEGPLLGLHTATYGTRRETLGIGGKLIFGTDGTTPQIDGAFDLAPLLAAAERHRHLAAEPFVNAVALELLAQIATPDDFTLIALERPRT